MAMKRIGIVVGGPAPGTNAAIAAAVIEAVKLGCTPIGFHDGFHFLAERYTDEQHEMTIEEVSRAHLAGGVILGASRTDVGADTALLRNAVDALRKLAIDALVAIGGDDLVRSVWAVDQESGGRIRVVLLPKSIDNDLAIPSHVPTLGFETARHVGVQLVKNLMEDARTSGRWYLGVTMGRPTGHLTLAAVARLAIEALSVRPLRRDWDATLARCDLALASEVVEARTFLSAGIGLYRLRGSYATRYLRPITRTRAGVNVAAGVEGPPAAWTWTVENPPMHRI